ncbi:MAG: hypothetical protein LQ340_008136, partial [Diploschistes diacapsis]
MLGKGYGMPSSHAQFLVFFATYLSLFLLLRRHTPQPQPQPRLRLHQPHAPSSSSSLPKPTHSATFHSTAISSTTITSPPTPKKNPAPAQLPPCAQPSALPALHIPMLASTLVLALAAVVAASRVYLDYHTPRQVLVGCSAGWISAVLWFAATSWLRRAGWLEWGLETGVCRALRVRDLCTEEDLVEAG